jgi:HTH-type transcriptional regulator / antitoxin HigA
MSRVISRYLPDYAVAPGETLRELIETVGMSQAELAERTGRPKKTINGIIMGKAAITPDTALQLERVLGMPASFWNNLERQYQEALARQEEDKRLAQQLDWLTTIPVRAMIKLRWIDSAETPIDQLREVLRFFAVASPQQWHTVWQNPEAAFRKSPAFASDPGAVAAWLRQGEIEAQQIRCAPFDANRFRQALVEVRKLTKEPPEVFQRAVVRLCAEAGVAVVFVPELPGTHVSGTTRWLTPTKALIQLSLRYKTDDHLWFTFFHEAGHILLHGKRDVFLENDGSGTADHKEEEANQFAADFLIAPSDLAYFVRDRRYFSKADIAAFAEQIGIAPGIIVGRLQHDGLVAPKDCNGLKQRFVWAVASASG